MSENGTEELSSSNPTRKRLIIVIVALAAALVVLLGVFFWQLYIAPQRDAQNALDSMGANSGPLTPANSSLVTFAGQQLEGANTEQKALASGDSATTPPAFIFTNGKSIDGRSVVDFYFDFSDQRSRDALIFNSSNLKAMVESGQIELRLHPLFGGRAYSMYAAEAVAETFAAQPDRAWDVLMALLRNAPALTAVDSNDALVDGLVNAVRAAGATAVDQQSIKNGTFASWLLSIGNDPALNSGVSPKLPHLLIDGKQPSLSMDQLNDPNAFRQALIKEIAR